MEEGDFITISVLAISTLMDLSQRHEEKVGIYGYSARKFGLGGAAEALQQEVIGYDIHVSLIFPPDTETPGFAEENKRSSQLINIILASFGAMKAEEVAKRALSGIQSGSFIVPCNFKGFLLSIAAAGLSPQRSFLMVFNVVVTTGLVYYSFMFPMELVWQHRKVVCTKKLDYERLIQNNRLSDFKGKFS